MNNSNTNEQDANKASQELYAARIGLLGNILSTLGDALQTIGSGIELQLLEKESMQNAQSQTDSADLEALQKQIDELTNRIKELE